MSRTNVGFECCSSAFKLVKESKRECSQTYAIECIYSSFDKQWTLNIIVY
jgi:hypothetical protein